MGELDSHERRYEQTAGHRQRRRADDSRFRPERGGDDGAAGGAGQGITAQDAAGGVQQSITQSGQPAADDDQVRVQGVGEAGQAEAEAFAGAGDGLRRRAVGVAHGLGGDVFARDSGRQLRSVPDRSGQAPARWPSLPASCAARLRRSSAADGRTRRRSRSRRGGRGHSRSSAPPTPGSQGEVKHGCQATPGPEPRLANSQRVDVVVHDSRADRRLARKPL